MLVRDLLGVPGLRLRLLGDAAGSARPVVGTCTVDLPRPGRYVGPGQLVLTGLVWRRGPADSETFVAEVAAAGASALAAGEGLLGHVPDDVMAAAGRHGLPLLAVPADVPFGLVEAHVSGRAESERVRRLTADLARQRRLLRDVAEGRALADLALATSRELRLRIRVLTPTGRAVVPGVWPLPEETVDDVVRAALSAPGLPHVVRLAAGTWSVLHVGGPEPHRATSWLLVVDGDHTAWEPATADLVAELAAVAALERSRLRGEARTARALADEAVRAVEDGADPGTLGGCLARCGLDPDAELVAVAADVLPREEGGAVPLPPGLCRDLLADAVTGLGAPAAGAPPVVGVGGAGGAVAFLPAAGTGAAPEERTAALRRALARAAPALGGARVAVGLGVPAAAPGLADALQGALHARRVAAGSGAAVAVVPADGLVSVDRLLRAVPGPVRSAFAADVLGPLLDPGSPAQVELLTTLRVFVECSGSWARAAERLHVHPNTVRYRIGRVGELLGRDLRTLDDLVDVHVALRVL
ncbi:PucR family transcriptional regulator ligand-binding domain-containing protein [Kineococcus sp. NUM-3379]